MSDKPTVVELLSAVMAEVQSVGKTGRNTEQGYNFRGVDAVVNAVGPVLRQHGVIVLPVLEEATLRDVRTSKDKPARESTVRVRYVFYGPAGDSVDAVVPGESMDTGDKGMAKAMSVAYRILWLQALCIPTDEPDPDTQSYERGDEAAVTHQEAVDLFAVIMDARDDDALRVAYEAVVAARKEQRLSDRETTQLIAHIKKRKVELDEAAGDDAGHSNGSSAATSPVGARPGPDGAGAGDG